jgi:RNA polymerase sigma factor (sigma-70 family)
MREYRPQLYRTADALDRSGGARELADGLYAELYGLTGQGDRRQSLLSYFHGRSSLATWLRAVLAQRNVDRLRASRRLEPLPDEVDATAAQAARAPDPPNVRRAGYLSMMQRALSRAIARLEPRDRLRLDCYYAQEMTLAAIGRAVREHEATVSRHLARTRKALREDVERQLADSGFGEAQITECFASVVEDAGPMDLRSLLEPAGLARGARKKSEPDRSE